MLDNRIWLAGGLLGPDQATNETEYYDPTLRTWSAARICPSWCTARCSLNYHGQLWLIGGFLPVGHNLEASASDHVLILDPAQNRWVEGPPLHHARAAGAAAVVGDQIVVAGEQVEQTDRGHDHRDLQRQELARRRTFRSRAITWRA